MIMDHESLKIFMSALDNFSKSYEERMDFPSAISYRDIPLDTVLSSCLSRFRTTCPLMTGTFPALYINSCPIGWMVSLG